jgi:hypothetical protein
MMAITVFENGNRLDVRHDRVSLILPGRRGRFNVNRTGFSGSGEFTDRELLRKAINLVTSKANFGVGMRGLAEMTIEELRKL